MPCQQQEQENSKGQLGQWGSEAQGSKGLGLGPIETGIGLVLLGLPELLWLYIVMLKLPRTLQLCIMLLG